MFEGVLIRLQLALMIIGITGEGAPRYFLFYVSVLLDFTEI